MHYARASRKLRRASGASGNAGPLRSHIQRCAVRVTYLSSRTRGQWRAHGRYLARESATESKSAGTGFNRERDGIDLARELEKWQSAGDQRLWKVILSPEFGDRIDPQRLARDLVGQMEKDFGTGLEWIAVTHHNTEHPHVHMVIRGVTGAGESLQFKREYVKHGIRRIAEEMCTRQLGYRTSRDAAEAELREIGACRFTALDRALLWVAEKDTQQPQASHLTVANPTYVGGNETARHHANHLGSRLAVLHRMGLAESMGSNIWRIRRDLEEILRAMQRTGDRQKTLAAHGAPLSDKRLPIQVLDTCRLTTLDGRVLVHGEDEQSGRRYLMLEGTDAKVHLIYCTAEMEEARSNGKLRTNSFVRLRSLIVDERPTLDIRDYGDANQVLKNRLLLGENARALLNRGVAPTEEVWGGWLGKYQAAVAATARDIQGRELKATMSPEHRRDRSRGR